MTNSGFREDLLGAGLLDAVDESGATEHAVVVDHVRRGPRRLATSAGDAGPLDLEAIPDETACPLLDGAGDDPLDHVLVVDVGVGDGDGPGVLDADRIDPVDRVDPEDALVVADAVTRERTRSRADQHGDEHGREGDERAVDGRHVVDCNDALRIPRWAKVLTAVFAVIVASAMAFALFKPIKVLPRIRLAPGYALVDQQGDLITSEDGRGAITVYAFAPLGCGEACDDVDDTMSEIRRRAADVDLGDTPLRMVTVVLDDSPDTAELAQAAARVGADSTEVDGSVAWHWLGGTADQVENVVGLGFRRSTDVDGFQPSYAIVDGWGVIRGEYRYRTLTDDADKIVSHIDILGSELRNGSGVASWAYGAAHVFQCYP